MAAEIGRAAALGDRLEAGLPDRATCLLPRVIGMREQRRAGEDHRHRVRYVLAKERRSRAVRGLGHQRGRGVVVAERDEQRLRAGDRSEEREHEIGENVAVAVQGRNHQRLARVGDQQRERRVDQLGLVLHVGWRAAAASISSFSIPS